MDKLKGVIGLAPSEKSKDDLMRSLAKEINRVNTLLQVSKPERKRQTQAKRKGKKYLSISQIAEIQKLTGLKL